MQVGFLLLIYTASNFRDKSPGGLQSIKRVPESRLRDVGLKRLTPTKQGIVIISFHCRHFNKTAKFSVDKLWQILLGFEKYLHKLFVNLVIYLFIYVFILFLTVFIHDVE